jgi:preprotein translocase subunit SecY
MFKQLAQIWNSKELRNKILFTLGIILVVRLLAQITIPGADTNVIKGIFARNQLLGAFSLLTGGSAENFSIILMGLSPYINASIIVQLLTVIVPSMENLSKEGEQGRRKINQYTRWLSLPIAFIQSFGMIALLNSQTGGAPIIANISSPSVILPVMVTITAGTVLMMWLGELITEKGMGNGISILIFAGIISSIPAAIGQNLTLANQSSQLLVPFVIEILITIALTIIVVLISESERRIPILYASRGVRGAAEKSNLPMKINQAGMIPIIFSLSVVSFPGIIAQFMLNSNSETLKSIANFITTYFNVNSPFYSILYFVLIIAFTFFYVSITFNPEEVADNIQKRGGYIPGIRPGKQTVKYLGDISNRLNLWGGLFIAFIAISPNIIQTLTGAFALGSVASIISGAGMIIVVSVVLEVIRQINAQLVMHDYNKLY